ncbi:MAG: heat-inducible transcription repressor HrcA [Chthonomonadales bacterium]|nr:heat-inducible transcription repressor HrcA [Chthonomonadales bacterium]
MTLEPRKGRILHAVVSGYVETGDPIGSEWLAAHFDFGCRSATLRNEMAEMSERGYLAQPHPSSGRVPTHRGYRYYVDRLMTPQRVRASGGLRVDEPASDVDEVVKQACRLLASMTQYPSVASQPMTQGASLHRLYLSLASPRHVLVVLLLSTGHVEHRIMDVREAPAEEGLQRAAAFLNEAVGGEDLQTIARGALGPIPAELGAGRAVIARAYQSVRQAARALAESRIFLEGTGHILRQREFQDVLRLDQLLSVLAEQSVLFDVFSRAFGAGDVQVVIGPESRVLAMQECSVVASPYHIGEVPGGFIGVFGPTRMHYDRTVGAVRTMARHLSAVLTRMSLN